MSIKIGFRPKSSTDDISETQVSVGTITSQSLYNSFTIDIVIRFAEAPELTMTEYLTPNQFDHIFSKELTFLEWVNTGSF
jgi:riboflavin synthase